MAGDGQQGSWQQEAEKIYAMLLGVLRDALPRSVSDETVAEALKAAQQQEMRTKDIYVHLLEPDKRLEAPFWGIELHSPSGDVEQFLVPKALDGLEDTSDLLVWLATFGLLCAPTSRAILMGLGYRFQFKFAKCVKKKGAIVEPN